MRFMIIWRFENNPIASLSFPVRLHHEDHAVGLDIRSADDRVSLQQDVLTPVFHVQRLRAVAFKATSLHAAALRVREARREASRCGLAQIVPDDPARRRPHLAHGSEANGARPRLSASSKRQSAAK
jgi:hypothetical protein